MSRFPGYNVAVADHSKLYKVPISHDIPDVIEQLAIWLLLFRMRDSLDCLTNFFKILILFASCCIIQSGLRSATPNIVGSVAGYVSKVLLSPPPPPTPTETKLSVHYYLWEHPNGIKSLPSKYSSQFSS